MFLPCGSSSVPERCVLSRLPAHVAGPTSLTGVIHVPRAYGRVDMTNGLSKFMLFRVEKEPEDRWNIIEQDSYQMRPFDRASFEETLQSLLE